MNSFEQGLRRYLSEQQLAMIQSRKIGIGGAGGLGSNVAVALVRCGFRDFEIIDHDVVDATNLNRQAYLTDDIGRDKVSALNGHLRRINPDARVTVHKDRWSPESGTSYFQGCSFLIEAFDEAETKHRFVEYYQDRIPVLVSGVGIAAFGGDKPLAIKKTGNIYFVGDGTTAVSSEHPPLAPRVMTCAALMAGIVLDLALQKRL